MVEASSGDMTRVAVGMSEGLVSRCEVGGLDCLVGRPFSSLFNLGGDGLRGLGEADCFVALAAVYFCLAATALVWRALRASSLAASLAAFSAISSSVSSIADLFCFLEGLEGFGVWKVSSDGTLSEKQ